LDRLMVKVLMLLLGEEDYDKDDNGGRRGGDC
jgi:hypothetical protein